MNKRYKKIVLVVSFIVMVGILGYNFISKEKTKSENENSLKEKVTTLKESNNNKNTRQSSVNTEIKKEREFKDGNLKYNDKSIPVIMYHSIDYEAGNELRVSKDAFREQMKYLKDKGYTTLSLDELYSFMVNNKPIPEKSVVLTFDDGYKDNYENAYPILKEFGFNAAVFIIVNCIDKEKDYLTSQQLKEMDVNGVSIESHTINHDQLDKLPYNKQVETLKSSKEYIEKLLNKKVKYIGYPYGKTNDSAIKAAKNTGYKMAFTTVSGWSNNNQGMYTLHRVYISANYDIKEFERRLTNSNYNVSTSNKKSAKP